jgi:hypothetical protein
MLTDLVEANFVKRNDPESERSVTLFKSTDDGGAAANPRLRKKAAAGLRESATASRSGPDTPPAPSVASCSKQKVRPPA